MSNIVKVKKTSNEGTFSYKKLEEGELGLCYYEGNNNGILGRDKYLCIGLKDRNFLINTLTNVFDELTSMSEWYISSSEWIEVEDTDSIKEYYSYYYILKVKDINSSNYNENILLMQQSNMIPIIFFNDEAALKYDIKVIVKNRFIYLYCSEKPEENIEIVDFYLLFRG